MNSMGAAGVKFVARGVRQRGQPDQMQKGLVKGSVRISHLVTFEFQISNR